MEINQNTFIYDDNALIRKKSELVKLPLSDEDRTLLQEMHQYVLESTDEEIAKEKNLRPAVGLSAIQVGVAKQMCAIVVNEKDKDGNDIHYEYCLVNPKIISSSVQPAYLESGEGCLSVASEHQGHVIRKARIKVEAYDMLQDKTITIRARGYLAIVMQHEFDHFQGILFYDRIDSKEPFKELEDAMVI